MSDLLHLIHKQNPYDGFPAHEYQPDPKGWCSDAPIFEEIISQLPKNLDRQLLIIEVGSWKGASAIHMATLAKKHGVKNFKIVCVDTRLGSYYVWMMKDDPDFYPSLNTHHGYPRLYYQFMKNVLHHGHEDVIIPFPITSNNGALFFKQVQINADVTYIDASHDYEDVAVDMKKYWKVLNPGGILFGDDYSIQFHGVVRAVSEFSEKWDRPLGLSQDGKWFFKK